MIQTPITLLDFVGNIADGAFIATNGIPVLGLNMAQGMVYSDRDVVFKIKQGINEQVGGFLYRHIREIDVVATEGKLIEFPICGKYLSLEIENSSGAVAYVEAFFSVRAYE